MAPQDATMFWLSARTRNDLFLLYSFADAGAPTETLRTAVAARSARIPALRVRLRETPGDLAYPSWVPCEYSADQFVEHPLPRPDWAAVEAALGDLLGTGVDATVHPWKLHVFRGVAGAPMRASDDELATVVVLQMSHALADGRRAAGIARELFSEGDGYDGEPRAAGAAGGASAGRAADDRVVGRLAARISGEFAADRGEGHVAEAAVDRAEGQPDEPEEDHAAGPSAEDHAVGQAANRTAGELIDRAADEFVTDGQAGQADGSAADRSTAEADELAVDRGAPQAAEQAVRTGPTGLAADKNRAELRQAFGGAAVAPVRGRGSSGTTDGVRRAEVSKIAAEFFATLRGSRIPGAVWGAARIPAGMVRTAVRGYRAYQAQSELAALTEAGKVPPPGPGFAPSAVNKIGAEGVIDHRARMIVCAAEELRVPGWTITVVVLTAVSVALAEYLAVQGESVSRLGSQVPMALSSESLSHNNYRSLGVELFIDEPDLRLRADRVAAALAERRLRAQHPLLSAQDRVTAVTPAPILRRDVDRYPIDSVPDSIAGHTVVSSVHRGPADLTFGGGPVRCTGGFPALGAVMHLTHGVHGLGDTVTVSIHADAAVIDVDSYADLLRTALFEVTATLAHR
ncbi:wax ester/triacylglycerol synthase family O-acyltransferase [Nocardia amikacinitolerans]|uniref:wax ester/triacylglycerol synthase family O-acyltransferase n=1 Tax=Nocardia amikacinitolerans TaxID=756689 RepID=UPI0020A4068F|nr:wax ester/triacylglycerol synthase family O-acyltransferase [Nocardia amikacinitolerans]